jgi:SAM-dependent methyltransferase
VFRFALGLALLIGTIMTGLTGCTELSPASSDSPGIGLRSPDDARYTAAAAQRMIRTSQTTLAPVYAPLAEQIAGDFDLEDKTGIGIDVGGGPGTLILELCKRTKLHWINADINPHSFGYFFEQARLAGFEGRVSAIFADAHALPFRDGYADIIVSRGTFHFFKDKPRAFAEIYRVLKPGGLAYIGRGLARTMPPEAARRVRARQGGMKYDLDRAERVLRSSMEEVGVRDFIIHRPEIAGAEDVNYGIWVELHKPRDP